MAQGNFMAALDFTMLPANDGQPCHVDSGGATSYGVTRATWSRWIKRPASDDDMRAVTKDEVAPLYQAWYWNTIAGDGLPHGIDLVVFDHGVLSGETTSVKHLQEVLRVSADGWVGTQTLAFVNADNPELLLGKLSWRQECYYRSLATFSDNPGWLTRLDRRIAAALAMVKG